ncbi:MAG: type II toxin-antitoxin system HicB family antitoxin [Acidobacteria bacterium]|nr:type II toxin-antitoxin system HicB family antitoxin [Acidobacteriota bacterium]
MRFTAVIEKTNTGFSAYVPDLPGCVAAGETIEETQQLLREAVALYIEETRATGAAVPQSSTVATVIEVPV